MATEQKPIVYTRTREGVELAALERDVSDGATCFISLTLSGEHAGQIRVALTRQGQGTGRCFRDVAQAVAYCVDPRVRSAILDVEAAANFGN